MRYSIFENNSNFRGIKTRRSIFENNSNFRGRQNLFERRVIESKKEKRDKLGKKLSFVIAKQNNDPDYIKLQKAMALVKRLKEKIKMKYGARGKILALR
jgi:hypothetical protein